jgi:hypothetical protein
MYQSIVVLAVALLSLTGLQSAQAQAVWKQTIEVKVPVERGSEISAFRDKLIEQIREQSEDEEGETIQVKRESGEDEEPQSLSSIESELISEGWGGLNIANTAYISYEFTDGRDGFNERITSVNFVRQRDGEGPDVPVFYIDTEGSQFFRTFLREEGVQGGGATGNIAHEQPFRDILLFGRLMRQRNGAITTSFNGEPINAQEVNRRTNEIVDRIVQVSLDSR